MEKINKATAIYTGGNQYCYYAELENGNWIMGGEDFLIIVDTNPLADKWKTEYECASDYEDWQREHLIREIEENEYHVYLNALLDEIFKGNSIAEYDNYSIEELKRRYLFKENEKPDDGDIANILYNMTLDMDYADYIEYADQEINQIKKELENLNDDNVLRQVIENIAMQNEDMKDWYKRKIGE